MRISKTKGGNVRINLKMEELVLLKEALLFEDEYLGIMHDKIEDFINQENDQEATE